MIITIENTNKIVQKNGTKMRVWEGETNTGIKVICFISAIAVSKQEQQMEFEKNLQTISDPEFDSEPISLKLLI